MLYRKSGSPDSDEGQGGAPGLDPIFGAADGAPGLPVFWLTSNGKSGNHGHSSGNGGAFTPFSANPAHAGPTLSLGSADPQDGAGPAAKPTPPAWGLDSTQPGFPGTINATAVEHMLQVATDRLGHPPTDEAKIVISGLGGDGAATWTGATGTPTVTTNASDYAPGSTAEITATGFAAGDDIKFTLQVVDPTTHAVLRTGQVWDVLDGSGADGDHTANGTVLTDLFVNLSYANTTLKLTATDTKTGQTASTIFTDASTGANLNDWADGKAPDAVTSADSWTNGNLNSSKAHYKEGESVPFEVVFTGLDTTKTYSVILTWDTTKAGLHAFDYLTSYNFSFPSTRTNETFPNPLIGTSLFNSFAVTAANPTLGASTVGIPLDPRTSSMTNGSQILGQTFDMWGGNLTGGLLSSSYALSGTYTGDSNTSITLTFTPTMSTAVLAWGDHIASDINWGPNSGAASISGSPYHQAISPGLNFTFGSQDHQIASNVVEIPDLALSKSTSTSTVSASGDVIHYTIDVTNTGNLDLPSGNVLVSDPFADTGSLVLVGGNTTDPANLNIGETWTYTATHTVTQAQINAGGTLTNTAIVSDSTDHVTADPDDTGTATTTVSQGPDLALSKSTSTPTVSKSGDVISYTIDVTNTGNIDLASANVVVTDPFADANSLMLVGGNTNDTGHLNVGETWTYTATHTVSQSDLNAGGTLTNTAVVSDSTDHVTADPDDTATATTTVVKPPIIITGSPQFNFPNDITKIQPKVGGGASFTFNPGGYVYWDLYSPDISKAQIDTRQGSFSSSYANLTLSIVQIWSSQNSTTQGAAIYRIYAADNTAATPVSLANSTNIVSYSIIDNTGAPASSTNKDLIDLINADPFIGNFNNFSNIQNALNTTHSGYPTNDGFTFPGGTSGTQTQVWLSTSITGTAAGETPRTFLDTASGNVALYGTNNTSPAGDSLAANTANDLIDGRGGGDTITAGNGNDYLYGGQGNVAITGGSGNDTLAGSYGSNTLIGGAGADVFILQRGEIDTIKDFVSGTDHLWIDTFVGSNGTTGNNGIGTAAGQPGDSTGIINTPVDGVDFVHGPNVSPAVPATGSKVFYNETSGQLWFAIAGEDPAVASTPLAILQGHPALAAGDIRYDPTAGSLDQLVQAAAGTPLGGNSSGVATNVLVNAADPLWNQHQLAASTA